MNTFKRVIGIRVNWHISKGILKRLALIRMWVINELIDIPYHVKPIRDLTIRQRCCAAGGFREMNFGILITRVGDISLTKCTQNGTTSEVTNWRVSRGASFGPVKIKDMQTHPPSHPPSEVVKSLLKLRNVLNSMGKKLEKIYDFYFSSYRENSSKIEVMTSQKWH